MLSRLIATFLAFLLRRLGVLLRVRGQESFARHCYAHARSLDPGAAASLYLEARACWETGDHGAARVLLQSLLNLDPGHAQGRNLLGAIHFAAEDFAAAEALFRQAIDLAPDLAAAHNNLGNIFVGREDFSSAEPRYRAALACDPEYVEALSNLGMTLNRQGRYKEAEGLCRRALQLRPQFAGALNNLANTLLNQDRRGEAIDCYRAALRLQADLPEAHLNLARALNDPEQLLGSLDHYRRVLERKPDSYLAHLRIGTALQVMGDWDGSEHHLEMAEGLRPNAAEVLALRGNNASRAGDHQRADKLFRRALLLGADSGTHSSHLFNRIYDPGLRPADFLREAREWAILHAESDLPPQPRHANEGTGRRLRIGYLSKDFARHSVAYFIEPVIASHDRSRFEIFCYSNNPKPDAVTERIEKTAEHWRDIAFVSNEEAFRQITNDGIDILVELSGHTTGNRLYLLSRKPAPVQVSYLGYPVTTGLADIDYRIVDAITDPPGEADAVHTEALVRLPGGFLTYLPGQDPPAVTPPPVAARGHITFGSFNNPIKINAEVVTTWARILQAVPGSRLLLKGLTFSSNAATDHFREMFAVQGIGAERIELMAWHPEVKSHLELYGQIDIALDPFPYNGTTTTCEALWMGVPVLTLGGDRHSARVGASLLAAVGLSEFVSSSRDEYVACAVRLAADPARLAALRTSLRQRMQSSPLLDAEDFTRKLEAAYDTMWQSWLDKQSAAVAEPAGTKAVELCALSLCGGARICLPDSLEVMTRYVVEEQGDWFEQETSFVRAFAEPGMKVIDIGANFGVYALALGSRVGVTGRVWAFEPSSDVAAALRRSCAENDYAQVEVIEAAVAERSGRARLLGRGGAELQQIVFDDETPASAGQIAVTCLDEWTGAADWPSIDFIKIDAEGQEAGIVRGGQGFFATQSPLVMAEYLNGAERNDEMISAFAALGYAAWRLVPGLQLLAPVEPDDEILDYAPPLNLFFCKPDRAEKLAAADRLALVSAQTDVEPVGARALADLFALPYARPWTETWCEWARQQDQLASADSGSQSYRTALEHYALSRDAAFSRTSRWRHLSAALEILAGFGGADASIARRLTHARLLYEAGLGPRANGLLATVIPRLLEGEPELAEPFIPPCARYERFAPAGAVSDWLLAACFEQQEIVGGLTGYLDPAASLRRLRDIRDLGYGDAHITRRAALIVRRFDQRRVRFC